jgi:hypothetical protein
MNKKMIKIIILAAVLLPTMMIGYLGLAWLRSPVAPGETIAIGSISARMTGPVYVAQEQGVF